MAPPDSKRRVPSGRRRYRGRVDLALLETTLREHGEPAYRAGQVWEWTAHGAEGYEAMTNLPRALRDALAESVPFSTLAVETERESRDGTVKTLFRTADGHAVEAVLMRYRDGRRSLCLSSQSGCPLTCTFCATGAMAFGRNLTASEIVDQALHFRRRAEVDHAVFMGMGEPMLNLDEVLAAARRLPAVGITHRRTTISTVGWLPGLTRFVDEVDEPIRLALSLHAPDDELRSRIMPVNDRYRLADVLVECRRHAAATNRRVFVEYVMLAGVNDSPEQGRALAALLGRDHFKVNLIPYNPWAGSADGDAAAARPEAPPAPAGRAYDGSPRGRIGAFKAQLERGRVPVTVRLTRGRDIEAACGQLAAAPRAGSRRSRASAPPVAT
jgi:23S rRNA (adenine2503-C2)-methyltransferase